ncbi:hypothetical protein KKA69_02420, partial [Patescibacteria group bacterium]|nr:hypothetical protein [Patescibacteria group bacterium]
APIEWTRAQIGLRKLRVFIGGELTARIEKAVLGTLRDTRHWINNNKDFIGRVWWENPNLQDVPVLISLGISPELLEAVERAERECERSYTSQGMHKTRSRLRLQGLSSDLEGALVIWGENHIGFRFRMRWEGRKKQLKNEEGSSA